METVRAYTLSLEGRKLIRTRLDSMFRCSFTRTPRCFMYMKITYCIVVLEETKLSFRDTFDSFLISCPTLVTRAQRRVSKYFNSLFRFESLRVVLCLLSAVGSMWPTPSVPHDSYLIVPSAICHKTHMDTHTSSPSIFSHMSCTFINHTGLWCFHMASQICLPTLW